jgi:regulatory protein
MRRQPKKLANEEQLYTLALRALMRRAHSVHEMHQALERRAEEPAHVPRILKRLKEQNLLDDARYARQFARYHAESRRQGRYRIARELRARGVPDRHIEAALEELFGELDESTLVRQRIERRLRQTRGPLDRRKLASLCRALLRAGFSSEVVWRELRAQTKLDAKPLPDPESLQTGDEPG